jgi:hypothetical protein
MTYKRSAPERAPERAADHAAAVSFFTSAGARLGLLTIPSASMSTSGAAQLAAHSTAS